MISGAALREALVAAEVSFHPAAGTSWLVYDPRGGRAHLLPAQDADLLAGLDRLRTAAEHYRLLRAGGLFDGPPSRFASALEGLRAQGLLITGAAILETLHSAAQPHGAPAGLPPGAAPVAPVDREAGERLLERLRRTVPAALRSLLDWGAAANAVLLAAAGRRVLLGASADLPEHRPRCSPAPGLAVEQSPSLTMQPMGPSVDDLAGEVERLLGWRPADVAAAIGGGLHVGEIDGGLATLLAGAGGRVRACFAARQGAGDDQAKMVTRPTVALAGPDDGELIGLDARSLLPPFLPGGGAADVALFTTLLRRSSPSALLAWAPRSRQQAARGQRDESIPTLPAVLAELLAWQPAVLSGGPAVRLRRIGAYLEGLGSQRPADLRAGLHARWTRRACAVLRAQGEGASLPGGDRLSGTRRMLADPEAFSLRGTRESWKGLAEDITSFGRLLQVWPDLWSAAAAAAAVAEGNHVHAAQ